MRVRWRTASVSDDSPTKSTRIDMPIPDYQTLMLPLLKIAADGREHRFRDAIDQLATEFDLTATERAQLLPSETAPVFDNRVGWARTYLKQAGLLRSARRGVFEITDAGRALLAEGIRRVDISVLERYETFRAFRNRRRERDGNGADGRLGIPEPPADQTPEDALAAAYEKLTNRFVR